MNKLTNVVVHDDAHTIQQAWDITEGSMTMVSRLCVKSEHEVMELLLFY